MPLLSAASAFTGPYLQTTYRSSSIRTAVQNDISLELRSATPEDLPACLAIETASYPADEAATEASLCYRQEHASSYFQVALGDDSTKNVIGFICATRCNEFTEEAMYSSHEDDGKYLAIHSVVVEEAHRRKGIASAMLKEYLQQQVNRQSGSPVDKVVLLAKSHLLSFYVDCGFTVVGPSAIVHGQDTWYDLEYSLIRAIPKENESWFVKTEKFCKPFPQVKPYLEAHRDWLVEVRRKGHCITSGYRVDDQGKPGGGGMMFLAAKSYEDAMTIILQDPLVANECVDWTLNGWIGEVGDVQMR